MEHENENSTLNGVQTVAAYATAGAAIVSGIYLVGVFSVGACASPIAPITHHWFDFAEMLRMGIDWQLLGQGLAVQAAWAVLFGALAWSRFTTGDVTS